MSQKENAAAIVATKRVKDVDVVFYRYDNQLLFYPVLDVMLPCITFRESVCKCDKSTHWMQKMTSILQPAYRLVKTHGEEVCCTYQGFYNMLTSVLVRNDLTWYTEDLRIAAASNLTFPEPRYDLMFGFWHSQEALLTELLCKDMSGLLEAPTRYGKSHGVDTKLLTSDYNVVKVQDVKVGDSLMGPDGLPRKVVAIGRGREQSYRITPNKGEPFTCNASHILPLKVTGGAKMGGWKKGDIVCVRLDDYLQRSKTFKHVTKLWYAPVDFKETELPVDPWVVGVWIGDGCVSGSARLTKPDPAVQQGLICWAKKHNYTWEYRDANGKPNQTIKINERKLAANGRPRSAFRSIADMCTINEEKRIPKQYLTASRRQRLELLAGLIDTDGSCNNGMCYELTTKYNGLSEDIIRLCRGLGFRVTRARKVATIKSLKFSGEYWRMQISGDLVQVPCRGHKRIASLSGRVDPTATGFRVEDIGEQDYYGVTVEGPDKMFLLWDHLVTHNSTLMLNTLRAFPTLPAVLTAPGVDLIKQLYADVTGERGIKDREVKLIGGGKNQKPTYTGINVVSMDSLHKLEAGAIRLVLCDEPHAAPATSRLRQIDRFPYARRYGFGATLEGRSDGKDLLITGLFGPKLARRTYKEAVAEGAICPLHVIFIPVEVTPRSYAKIQDAYTDILFENHDVALLIAEICNKVIPKEQQTLVFVKTEKQADILADKIGSDPSVAMAKLLTNSERADMVEQVRLNQIKRCLCTRIFVQGVTFPDVRVLINAEAGTGTTSAIQKPGRLAQCRPGKKCGIIIDLQMVPPPGVSAKDYRGEFWVSTINHCKKRRDAYANKGYEIHDVKNIKELKSLFDSLQ